MASLVPKNGIIFSIADTAPSPSKDYCQIIVERDQLIYRWWKITLRKADARPTPGEVKETHEDFLYDERVQSEINRVFGRHMLEYVVGLAQGRIDFLPRLPKKLLIKIIRYLALEDILKLAQTSKMFSNLCKSDQLWEKLYADISESPITCELKSLAKGIGWRKLYFTNKLQLQIQLRRLRKTSSNEEAIMSREDSFNGEHYEHLDKGEGDGNFKVIVREQTTDELVFLTQGDDDNSTIFQDEDDMRLESVTSFAESVSEQK